MAQTANPAGVGNGAPSAPPDYRAMTSSDFLQAVGMDAKKWTDAFLQIWPDGNNDPGCTIGWFANAIMAGYDAGERRSESTTDASPSPGLTPTPSTLPEGREG